MAQEHQIETDPVQPELDEIEKMELQECYVAIRQILQWRVQLVVFFGAANLSLLGLAIQHRSSLLLIVAGSVLFFFIVVDFLVLTNLAPYLYSGLRLEWKVGREFGLLNCEVLAHSRGFALRQKIRTLSVAIQSEQLDNGLRDTIPSPFAFRGKAAQIVTIVAAIQIITGFLAPRLLGWSWVVGGSP